VDIIPSKLRRWFDEIRLTLPSAHGMKTLLVHNKDLKNSTYVFLRKNYIKKPFERPYDGLFKMLDQIDKTFTLKLRYGGRKVSIDIMKPTYIEPPIQQPLSQGHMSQTIPV